jgi:hypothetical protein
VGDDVRQRGLAEPGRAEDQGVVQRLGAAAGGADEDLHLLAHSRLADIVRELARPDGAVQRTVVGGLGRVDDAFGFVHPVSD